MKVHTVDTESGANGVSIQKPYDSRKIKRLEMHQMSHAQLQKPTTSSHHMPPVSIDGHSMQSSKTGHSKLRKHLYKGQPNEMSQSIEDVSAVYIDSTTEAQDYNKSPN